MDPSAVELPVGMPASFGEGTISARSDAWPKFEDDIVIRDGKLAKAITVFSGWSSKELLLSFIRKGFSPVLDGKGQPTRFEIMRSGAIEAIKDRGTPSHVISTLNGFGGPQKASKEIEETGAVFDDYPKPLALLEYLSKIVGGNDFIAMDFFAGSGTTAQAIMNSNYGDGGTRKFICIQLPEPTTKGSEEDGKKETAASRAGFKTISQVAIKRIEGASKQFKSTSYDGDFGFKVFKLDSSNIQAWNPDRGDLDQTLLDHQAHLVEGRSEQDLLYELLLKRGVDLTAPIDQREANGVPIYSIGYGVLFACLAEKVANTDVEALAQSIIDWHGELAPETDAQVVFRDSAFEDDIAKSNMTAILEQNGISHVRSL